MSQIVSNLYVGWWQSTSKELAMNIWATVSRKEPGVVLLSGISASLYRRDGQKFWQDSSKSWALSGPGGASVNASLWYGEQTSSKSFTWPDMAFDLDPTATSCTLAVAGPDGSFSFTLSGIPLGGVAPSGVTTTAPQADVGPDYITATSSVTNWGSGTKKHLMLVVMAQPDIFGRLMGYNFYDVNTVTQRLDANCPVKNGLEFLQANHQYWALSQADNGTATLSDPVEVWTQPYPVENLRVIANDEEGNVTFAYEEQPAEKEVDQASIVTRYELNDGDWSTATITKDGQTCKFTLKFTEPVRTKLKVYRRGHEHSASEVIYFTPAVFVGKLYAGDETNVARQLIGVLCSPEGGDNTAKDTQKIYVGDENGKAVEIFRKI